MTEFKKQLQFDSLMVADSVFQTQENIQIVDKLKWLSRVPLTVKAATLLAKSVENKDLITSQIQGYNYVEQDLRKDTNCIVNIGSGLSKIHHIQKQYVSPGRN